MSICDGWPLLASICSDYPTAIARCENVIPRSLSRHNRVPTGNRLLTSWLLLCSSSNSRSLTHSNPTRGKGRRFSVVASVYPSTDHQHLISSRSRMVCTVQDILIYYCFIRLTCMLWLHSVWEEGGAILQ